ncbi:MAG: S-layer homology domain-containing protein [Clostridia bacterium]|nr:S-layer homology domain-containing protein [Clostridia bacterium]
MKKILSITLTILILLSSFTVLAQDNIAVSLASVKSKIEVPANLSEFDSSVSTRKDKTIYRFNWYNSDRSESLSVTATETGIITNYSYYSNDMYNRADKQLSSFTRNDAQLMADNFLKKAIPEAFTDTDIFVYKNISVDFSENGTSYSVLFNRELEGIEVIGQTATVDILVKGENAIVTNMHTSFDKITYEDIKNGKAYIENKEEVYKAVFPAELMYVKKKYDDKEFSLVYRLKGGNGYISAFTGEKVEPFSDAELYLKNESMSDSVAGMGGSEFTPQELKELENVKNLISVEDAVKLIKSESLFNTNKNSKVISSRYNKLDGKYTLEVSLQTDENNGERFVLDAQTKELKSFYSYDYSYDAKTDKKLSEKEISDAEKVIDAVIKKYAGTVSLKGNETSVNNEYVSKSYIRLENNVPVDGNSISVTYKDGKITSYSKYFEDKTFVPLEGVIATEEAYNKVLEYHPIKLCYLNTGEEYKLCYTLDLVNGYVEIDAKTGEKTRATQNAFNFYNDLEKHWCKTAVEKLAQIGISFEGESFEPEKEITQLEMLRLFGAAVKYTSYLTLDAENLYKTLERENIVPKTERADASPVLREDAFVYLVRFLGYERIAKAEEIFTTKFADQNLISKGKLGYASILSGLKVINGNGSLVKPKDNLTRAEAVVMIYNLFTNIS